MMPGITLRAEAVGMMKSMLIVMSLCTAVHIGSVLYTAFNTSREVWAFVSGPGFYITILPMGVIYGFVMRSRVRARRASSPELEQIHATATRQVDSPAESSRRGGYK